MVDRRNGADKLFRDAAHDLAKHLLLGVLAAAAFLIGIIKVQEKSSLFDWPLALAAVAGIIILRASASLVGKVGAVHARGRIRPATGNRLAILLPRLVGDDVAASHRETLRETIRRDLGETVDIVLWPEQLLAREGLEADAEAGVQAQARAWLSSTNCDVIVWGRVRGQGVLSLRIGNATSFKDQCTYVMTGETLDMPETFTGNLTAEIVSTADVEAALACDSGTSRIAQLRAVVARIEALLDKISSPEMALTHSQILARLGEQLGDSTLTTRAVDAAISVVGASSGSLSEERLRRANANIASILMGLSYNSLDRSTLDKAMAYLVKARAAAPEGSPDINYGILMAMTGDRELRRDYVDKAVHEFQQIIGDEGRYDEETLGKAYHNLGIAYATLHGLGGDVEMLDCAISSFEQSLEFRRQGSSPLYWAKTKTCIGAALTKRGINLNSVKDLRHALHAFAEAKRVYQQTGDREKNAEVAYNIGCARMSLAAADQNQAGILKAIEDLTFAEAVWEAERGGKWMGTQNALGLAHLNLAAQSADAELALRAVSYFQTGRSVLEKSAHVKEWAGTSVNEARAHMIAGILTEDAGELARALELAEQAFSAISAVVGHPLVYKTNAAIADILVASYNLGGDTSLAVRAAKIYVQLAAALKSAGELGGYLEKSIKAASLMIIHYDATNEPASLATAANILSEVEREHVAVSDHGKEVSAPVAAELLRAEIEARQRRVELGFNSTAVDPQAE